MLHRVATKEREEIKRTTKQKMARRLNREGGNHLDKESNSQTTMEDTDGGLHPAVDGQSLDEDEDKEEEVLCGEQDFACNKHTSLSLSSPYISISPTSPPPPPPISFTLSLHKRDKKMEKSPLYLLTNRLLTQVGNCKGNSSDAVEDHQRSVWPC